MLQVSVPIAHELLGQCVKQGEALVQRASLVGDFSDYESWKAARKQWIDPTTQALEHMYGGSKEARGFADAAICPESVKRWQEQYSADLRCVEEAIELLKVLQGELAFAGPAGTIEPAPVEAESLPPEPIAPQVTEPTQSTPAQSAHAQVQQGPWVAEEQRLAEPPMEVPPAGSERAVGAELATASQLGAELAPHEGPGVPAERGEAGAPTSVSARTGQVLMAHGRDERWKQAVEHLLEQAGDHEIRIVNRRAERRRLTEILGEESPARYAIVLLTADDIGGPRLESEAEPFFSTRAHQEVVFEMGFLVAELSPGRVCVLYEDGVELPYDLDGVSHVRLDLAGTWRPKLLLHLRRAGFDYDMNKLAA